MKNNPPQQPDYSQATLNWLKEHEWSDRKWSGAGLPMGAQSKRDAPWIKDDPSCPCCGGIHPDHGDGWVREIHGHRDYCELAKAIATKEREPLSCRVADACRPIIASVVLFLCLCIPATAAELAKPKLWIYTTDHCPPCRQLKRDIEAGKLPDFEIKYLKPPEGATVPCIYYRDADKHWQRYIGWGPNSPKQFTDQWKTHTKGGR